MSKKQKKMLVRIGAGAVLFALAMQLSAGMCFGAPSEISHADRYSMKTF